MSTWRIDIALLIPTHLGGLRLRLSILNYTYNNHHLFTEYWLCPYYLFSCFTSINPFALWDSRSCYFLHSSDEGHRLRDVRTLIRCHKPSGPEWILLPGQAIVGYGELFTPGFSFTEESAGLSCFSFYSPKWEAHDVFEISVLGKQRKGVMRLEPALTKQRNLAWKTIKGKMQSFKF